MAFPKSGTYPSSKKKKKFWKKPSYSANSVSYTPEIPSLDLIVPDDCSVKTLEHVNQVTIYLNSLTDKKNPSRKAHDISRPCAVCKKPNEYGCRTDARVRAYEWYV